MLRKVRILLACLFGLGLTWLFLDFTGIAHTEENMFISQVLHKTFIELDEKGTKAAAATAIAMGTASAEVPMKKMKEVICDRPFAYMIVDCENDKPVFIGTVNNI